MRAQEPLQVSCVHENITWQFQLDVCQLDANVITLFSLHQTTTNWFVCSILSIIITSSLSFADGFYIFYLKFICTISFKVHVPPMLYSDRCCNRFNEVKRSLNVMFKRNFVKPRTSNSPSPNFETLNWILHHLDHQFSIPNTFVFLAMNYNR